jgi:multicomponent Na+:H+ antiporter subunit C
MNQPIFFSLVAMGLFTIGLYILLVEAHLLRKIMAFNIMGSSVFLLLIALAARYPLAIDLLPYTMVLIGMVIMVSFTALALMLARRIYRETGQMCLPDSNTETGKSL